MTDTDKKFKKGRSIRDQCFAAFDRGERPAAFAQEAGFNRSTVLTYWHQYKKIHGITSKDRIQLTRDPIAYMTHAINEVSERLGIDPEEAANRFIDYCAMCDAMLKVGIRKKHPLARIRAAAILVAINRAIVFASVLNEPPEAVIDHLQAQGIDTQNFQWNPSMAVKHSPDNTNE